MGCGKDTYTVQVKIYKDGRNNANAIINLINWDDKFFSELKNFIINVYRGPPIPPNWESKPKETMLLVNSINGEE